jgi:hypothetical protein
MKAIFVGGKYNGQTMNIEDVEKISNGHRSMDWSKERAMGACVSRKELDNQPLVDGYLGPMWDGDKLRYETQEVYDMLSH